MPGCAAVGCNNRSEKGYIMKCFPRDPELRKIWQERVARADWEPSNNSFLCHVHFEPHEWSVAQSGRIRLKRNAIPSIFTVTSTRKSPKKRKKLIHTKNENDCEDSQTMEYFEIDTECSSTGNLEGKDSDFHDTDEISQSLTFETSDNIYQVRKVRNTYNDNVQDNVSDHVATNSAQDGIIVISDECNTETDHFVKKNNTTMHKNESDKMSSNINGDQDPALNNSESLYIKAEVKSENISSKFEDNYDDIEEKLKQICDGRSANEEDYSGNNRTNCTAKTQDDTERNAEVSLRTDYKEPVKHEIGDILIDNRENVEIIFGTESGDEKVDTSQSILCISNSFTKTHEITDPVLNMDDIVCIKEENKVFNEDIEENFGKDEVHVIPNMRAAMKRKRRTREEIMKSIKKSIGSTSEQDVGFIHNSDISDNNTDKQVEFDVKTNNKSNIKNNNNHAEIGKTEFTIKVTGNPDDVCDVVQELTGQGNAKQNFQRIHNSCEKLNHKSVVTSVIKLKDYPINLSNVAKESCNNHEDFTIKNKDFFLRRNPLYLNNTETVNREHLKIEAVGDIQQRNIFTDSMPRSILEKKMLNLYNSSPTNYSNNKIEQILGNLTAHDTFYEHEQLQQRSKMQEEIIQKLTNQLIVFKKMETNLRKQNKLLQTKSKEAEMLTSKLNTRATSTQSLANNKRSLESKQRLIEELSSRVNYFEVINKKLMKTISLESQQRRKLEGNIKQKEDQIKELNWKLEKASKYLERAEKNTNTYKRKMLNMQTVMRRKKLSDEKMNWFNELLIDNSKGKFSEKILTTAVAIRNNCGKDGYIKLIDFGFPLPPLTALRRFLSNNLTKEQSNNETNRNILNKKEQLKDVQCLRNEMEIDTKDSGIPESDNKATELLNTTETITGTVQDIFNENNDGDDFTSHELKKHFMEELSAVM
ncbi:SPX and EXS domain-containing protein 4-like [Polistes fuscatus]|uniref:SPX and EXS domain-containing protein 4-like n=1 Tax=Polistes fuscatus TaxID=30207 RepID=UPI001CA96945|nr:SPX and EXS domain-containing protein 4-like [Polistes fuscatus]XP_043494395.1 SPX and EXS domain-containing protein 4-like [Polistes fuscatus]